MKSNSVVLKEAYGIIEKIGEAGIMAGIRTFNDPGTIAHVAHAVQAGLSNCFPDRKSVLINSDVGSGQCYGNCSRYLLRQISHRIFIFFIAVEISTGERAGTPSDFANELGKDR